MARFCYRRWQKPTFDLGHYERFTGVNAQKSDNVTAGQIYSKLLAKERKGLFRWHRASNSTCYQLNQRIYFQRC